MITNILKSIELDSHNVYFLYGEEAYLIVRYKNQLIEKFNVDEFNTLVLKNDCYYNNKTEKEYYNIIDDFANTIPLFSDKRLVILDEININSIENICDIFEKSPYSTKFLVIEKNIDKRKTNYKKLKKISMFLECELQKDLSKWCRKYLNNNKVNVDNMTINYLLNLLDNNMFLIKNTMDKIISLDLSDITEKEINLVVEKKIEVKIFDLIDNIIENNKNDVYREYYFLNEDPYLINAMIIRHFEILLKVLVGSKVDINRYFIDKYKKQANKYGYNLIIDILEFCVNIDKQMKQGEVEPVLANLRVLFELLYIKVVKK